MFVMGDESKDINMTQCVFDERAEDSAMFNVTEPNGRHVLDLASPYQRTVVQEILQLATDNPRCELSDMSYTDPRGYMIPLQLEQRHEEVRVDGVSPRRCRHRSSLATIGACSFRERSRCGGCCDRTYRTFWTTSIATRGVGRQA